jgi:acetyl esterase/lipase
VVLILIRWLVDFWQQSLGWLLFNRELPPVGRVIADIPYGADRLQRFDLIVPQGKPPLLRQGSGGQAFPVLVWVHGGAWIAGDKAPYTRICRSFAAEGYLVLNVNYRLAPGHVYPAALLDVASVMRWVAEHASEFGGDANRIFLAGDSAGAHLVSWYAAALRKPELLSSVGIARAVPERSVRGLLLFYGVYDCEAFLESGLPFMDWTAQKLLGVERGRILELARESSPLRHLGADFPPCFITAGERDPLYSQSVTLAQKLTELGVAHRAVLFPKREHPWAYHAFLNFYQRECSKIAMREAIAFLAPLKGQGR